MKSTFAIAPLLAGVCFCSTADASNLRIIGGNKVSLEQYPYMAALVGRGESSEQAFCGASVIASKWIVTAAHCVTDAAADSLDVLTGVSVLSKANTGQRIEAARIILHPDYSDETLENDIALIELKSETNAPVIKPATQADSAVFATDQAVSVAGWGNLLTQGEKYPDVLHAVDLKVSDFSSCSDVYGGLDSSQICATVPGGKKDSCQGDSGGPLVAKTESGPVQVGIVSFGDACASRTHPGVYTKVSEYSSFLKRAGLSSSIDVADPEPDSSADNMVTTPVQNESPDQVPVDNANTDTQTGIDNPDVMAGIDEFDSQEPEFSQNEDLELVVFEPFFPVQVDETSWGAVEIYNAGASPVTITNVQLPGNVVVYEQSDDCLAYELEPEAVCYIDLDWTPVNSADLNAELGVDLFDGVSNQTLSVALVGQVVEPVDIGNEIDWPEAEYYSTYPEEWELDGSNFTEGGSSIASEMQHTDSLTLVGMFNKQDDYELQFEYQLDDVNCFIYINDELAYELAAFEQWQQASLAVPGGAEVRWEFKATKRDRAERKVRLDALSVVKVASEINTDSDSIGSSPAAALAQEVTQPGTGSTGVVGLLALLLVMTKRRVVTQRRRFTS